MIRLGTIEVGEKVKIKVNGTERNFIVVQQGKPASNLYNGVPEDSTWLLMEDIYTIRQWHSSNNNNNYAESTINTYLNSSFYNQIESSIRNQVLQISLPYGHGNSTSTVGRMLTKVFLLAWREANVNTSSQHATDGAALSYFSEGGNAKRIAYYNGEATTWWLRTPYTGNSSYPTHVSRAAESGGGGGHTPIAEYGIRPAFILPQSIFISDDGTVRANTAPTVPENVTVPQTSESGKPVIVSWEQSTDAEGNLAGYIVERTKDGGTAWEEVYMGAETSFTDDVPYGTNALQYRVCAYDDEGLKSDWSVSEVIQNSSAIKLQLKEPLVVDQRPTKCIMKVNGVFPSGSTVSVQICNNGFDLEPAWEDITSKALNGQNFTFANEEKESEQWGVDIKVTVDRGTAEGDCYIDSITINSMNPISGGVDLEELKDILAEFKADILGSMDVKWEEAKDLIKDGRAKLVASGTFNTGSDTNALIISLLNIDNPSSCLVYVNGCGTNSGGTWIPYKSRLTATQLSLSIQPAWSGNTIVGSYDIVRLGSD